MPRLSINAAARLCARSRTTLYRAIARGALPRDAQGRVDTDDLIRLGYLTHAELDASRSPPAVPLTLHARMMLYFDRLDAALHHLEALTTTLHTLLRHLSRQSPPQLPPRRKKKRSS